MASVCRWLCWWLAIAATALEPPPASICQVQGCNCTTQHKYWQIVNCSLDNKQVLEVSTGMLPVKTIELSIAGTGGEVYLLDHAFSSLHNLQRVLVDSVSALEVRRYAFQGAGGASVLLQAQQCDAVRLNTGAFRDMREPLTLHLTRCAYVRLQGACFGFLQDAAFTDIQRLELADEAFTLDNRDVGHHGAVTTIRFNRVIIPHLGRDVFKSSLAEISLQESEVREVAGGAFSGNTIALVRVFNSSLHRVRGNAFSERTHLKNFVFTSSRLHHIDSNALLSGIGNFTIEYCNITTLSAGAVNAVVAQLIFRNNWVAAFRKGALTIRDWTRVSLDNNVFDKVSSRALDLPESKDTSAELTFIGNTVRSADSGALLALSVMSHPRIINNKFGHPCHCNIHHWLQETVGENCSESVPHYNYCSVDQIMSQCYELNETLMLISNFTDAYCGEDGSVIECKKFIPDANLETEAGLVASDDASGLALALVLGLALILAIIATAIILLIHGGLWLRRKGYCVQYRARTSAEDEDMVAAPSIQEQDPAISEIPEELTQDLLQMLRDKLEDPGTYHEAREMIERLYDHFIIEDSYTNNNRHDEETHLYEELGAAAASNTDNKTDTAGPFSFLRLIEERFGLGTTLAAEYSEPTDAEVHVYSELPSASRIKEDRQNEINEELQARTPSPAITSRPLPNAPGPSTQC